MNETNQYVAEMMRLSARAYAAHAAEQLLDRHPASAERFGAAAFPDWQANLVQRVNELAIAVEMEEPSLFRSQVEWAREAFAARALPVEDVMHSLQALHVTLRADLPERVGAIPGPYIEAALEALEVDAPNQGRLSGATEAERIALQYVEAAVSGDQRRAACIVLDAVHNGLSIRAAHEQVLLPAGVEIGRMWQRDEIGIAEEHAATATTCAVMSILAWQGTAPAADAPFVMLAGVEGDRHDVGLRATAGLLESGGCRAVSLGADLPVNEIVRAADESAPDMVILGATLTVHLHALHRAIRGLRELPSGAGIRILVGGPALARAPHLAERLEADVYLASPGAAISAVGNAATTH